MAVGDVAQSKSVRHVNDLIFLLDTIKWDHAVFTEPVLTAYQKCKENLGMDNGKVLANE